MIAMPLEPYFHVEDDTYCYPGSNVLRNKMGITNSTRLATIEGTISVLKMAELDEFPLQATFDTHHLKEIHRHIFEDIYDWAGEFRTVEISKGIPFCFCANIQTQLDRLFDSLREERYLRGIDDRSLYVSRLAYYLGELNAIHPFREGNGRTQRKLLEQLVRESGHSISFESLDSERMNRASADSMVGDYSAMESLLSDILVFRKQ